MQKIIASLVCLLVSCSHDPETEKGSWSFCTDDGQYVELHLTVENFAISCYDINTTGFYETYLVKQDSIYFMERDGVSREAMRFRITGKKMELSSQDKTYHLTRLGAQEGILFNRKTGRPEVRSDYDSNFRMRMRASTCPPQQKEKLDFKIDKTLIDFDTVIINGKDTFVIKDH